ncbi:hypothetical protein [Amycolatopsis sp. NBC_00438]|uniref:hypothetical protein n=1 Tax=Amycolatopsis sp. NBC_00438 TaxID=2903558 RepID=UPI002E20C689
MDPDYLPLLHAGPNETEDALRRWIAVLLQAYLEAGDPAAVREHVARVQAGETPEVPFDESGVARFGELPDAELAGGLDALAGLAGDPSQVAELVVLYAFPAWDGDAGRFRRYEPATGVWEQSWDGAGPWEPWGMPRAEDVIAEVTATVVQPALDELAAAGDTDGYTPEEIAATMHLVLERVLRETISG